jgi:hypothetical protein
VIRETTATATAPAQIAAVQEANRRRANGGEDDERAGGSVTLAERDEEDADVVEIVDGAAGISGDGAETEHDVRDSD